MSVTPNDMNAGVVLMVLLMSVPVLYGITYAGDSYRGAEWRAEIRTLTKCAADKHCQYNPNDVVELNEAIHFMKRIRSIPVFGTSLSSDWDKLDRIVPTHNNIVWEKPSS